MNKLFLIGIYLISPLFIHAQSITSTELLNRAISFHDPSSKWEESKIEVVVEMGTPNRPMRRTQFMINNLEHEFQLEMMSRGDFYEYEVDNRDSTEIRFNFLVPTDSLLVDSLNLTVERAIFWRDYYSYLYGLPMKLKDPGAIIDPEVESTRFQNKEVLALKVTYEEGVGGDTWYFYFDPGTYQLVGYRFYHDESANDGEYIVLEGLEIHNGLRIPKNRSWYVNEDGRLLGTDYLKRLSVK